MITVFPADAPDFAGAWDPASSDRSDSGSASVAVGPVRAGPADVAGCTSARDYSVCYPRENSFIISDADARRKRCRRNVNGSAAKSGFWFLVVTGGGQFASII